MINIVSQLKFDRELRRLEAAGQVKWVIPMNPSVFRHLRQWQARYQPGSRYHGTPRRRGMFR